MYLNVHSYYSYRYGVLSVEEILETAARLGIKELALTDINNTAGIPDFFRMAPDYGIHPVAGIDFRNGPGCGRGEPWSGVNALKPVFIGLARSMEGYRELNLYLSDHLRTGEPFGPRAPEHWQQVWVIYPPESPAAGARGGRSTPHNPTPLLPQEFWGLRGGAENLNLQDPQKHLYPLHTGGPPVALHTCTFRGKKDFNTHRLLRAIGENQLLSRLRPERQALPRDLFLSPWQLHKYMDQAALPPELLQKARELLLSCHIDFEFGRNKNKLIFTDSLAGDHELLYHLAHEGFAKRYGAVAAQKAAALTGKAAPKNGSKCASTQKNHPGLSRLRSELETIERLQFGAYFLINHDLVRYARHRGFFHVGRGSGANSLVAYCLGITDVDPIDLDLYFERFINTSRSSPPDFDIDFSWKDRDEIHRYLFEKHGTAHTSLLGAYNTFQYRAVIRELGKVFGLAPEEIERLEDPLLKDKALDEVTRLVLLYGERIRGLPSHLSVHAGGVLISARPITCYSALSLPPKGFPVTQFSMLEAEDLGLYKYDILSQRGLGHIRDTLRIIQENRGQEPDIHRIDDFKEDPEIKKHLRKGRTIGCFYIESPAMRMLLQKLECDTYKGLVAASSIIRPGVARSGMMREYILRFKDPGRRRGIHPLLDRIMQETFGVMVYQEDVIKVAHHFAGLSLEEADVLRRGMSGKYRSRAEFTRVQEQFFSNCRDRGYPQHVTQEVWRQIESFAHYSFAKGHSASYAVESYQSLFLKAHYPLEFMTGVINNFGGFYSTELYVHEARMAGATIHAPCIKEGQYYTCLKGTDLYLGLVHLHGLESAIALTLLQERDANGPYASLSDLCSRTRISLEQLRILIRIDALRSLNSSKEALLWEAQFLLGQEKVSRPGRDLFSRPKEHVSRNVWADSGTHTHEHSPLLRSLPALDPRPLGDALDQIELLGFPLCPPFELISPEVPQGILARELPASAGKTVDFIGYLVHAKHSRTITGELMYFGTFLDREGHFVDSVHFPSVARCFPFRGRGVYRVRGKVGVEFDYYSLQAYAMEKLPMFAPDSINGHGAITTARSNSAQPDQRPALAQAVPVISYSRTSRNT